MLKRYFIALLVHAVLLEAAATPTQTASWPLLPGDKHENRLASHDRRKHMAGTEVSAATIKQEELEQDSEIHV